VGWGSFKLHELILAPVCWAGNFLKMQEHFFSVLLAVHEFGLRTILPRTIFFIIIIFPNPTPHLPHIFSNDANF